ncbi:hypothetical protein A1Q2_04705 [Trichosporon asahii var. asahii CBS 8904]|uniref:Uncharacterized protein n=1 Tax=Trichosporon asahii var. asahii (strain CBS 8904) TaxID=1220162 RepID=K1VVY2_TRIAC|nr:hypothetical protein A1Q2_04705 [Trichosporon asahii var. asahii CBS 8904]
MVFAYSIFATSPPFDILDQPLVPCQQSDIFMGDSSDLLIWQDVFVHGRAERAVFSVSRSPLSPAMPTIPEAREETDEQTLSRRRQFSRRLRAMSIDLTKEENKVLHSLGCKLKPVLAKDGGAPDSDLPVSPGTAVARARGLVACRHETDCQHLDSLQTLKRISDTELDRWLGYYASDAALISNPASRHEKEHTLAQCIGVTGSDATDAEAS